MDKNPKSIWSFFFYDYPFVRSQSDTVLRDLDLSHNKFSNAAGEYLGQMLGNVGHFWMFSSDFSLLKTLRVLTL